MVFEVTIGIEAACGVIHRLGKLGFIPSYGYDRAADMPAGFKLLAWLHVLGAVALIGNFDNFESGLLFGLAFVGAWKVCEEVTGLAVDVVEAL
jgi:hypothetical protein